MVLGVKAKTIKLLEEDIRTYYYYLVIGKDSVERTSKALIIQKMINHISSKF